MKSCINLPYSLDKLLLKVKTEDVPDQCQAARILGMHPMHKLLPYLENEKSLDERKKFLYP